VTTASPLDEYHALLSGWTEQSAAGARRALAVESAAALWVQLFDEMAAQPSPELEDWRRAVAREVDAALAAREPAQRIVERMAQRAHALLLEHRQRLEELRSRWAAAFALLEHDATRHAEASRALLTRMEQLSAWRRQPASGAKLGGWVGILLVSACACIGSVVGAVAYGLVSGFVFAFWAAAISASLLAALHRVLAARDGRVNKGSWRTSVEGLDRDHAVWTEHGAWLENRASTMGRTLPGLYEERHRLAARRRTLGDEPIQQQRLPWALLSAAGLSWCAVIAGECGAYVYLLPIDLLVAPKPPTRGPFGPTPRPPTTPTSAPRLADKPTSVPPPDKPSSQPVPASNAYSGWGAIASNDRNRRWGMAWDKESQLQADNVAITECGSGCSVRVRFKPNQCGAFARGDGTSWGSGWGESRSEAQTNAVAGCAERGQGCKIETWRCNSQ
jgi:hypothetical protein